MALAQFASIKNIKVEDPNTLNDFTKSIADLVQKKVAFAVPEGQVPCVDKFMSAFQVVHTIIDFRSALPKMCAEELEGFDQ
eukprot:2461052-Karenia_brevis.AAC.1